MTDEQILATISNTQDHYAILTQQIVSLVMTTLVEKYPQQIQPDYDYLWAAYYIATYRTLLEMEQ